MMMITMMTITATNNLIFLGNNQPWLDAFLAEGWWVIFMMMTKMRMTTMATTMRRAIALASGATNAVNGNADSEDNNNNLIL